MTDERNDSVGRDISAALRRRHAEFEVPAFEALWQQAGERAAGERSQVTRAWTRHLPGPRRWAMAAALAALAVGAALVLRPEPGRDVESAPPAATAAAELPPMWYAPTDELLQIPSLSYAAQPATVTSYDPIDLEIR